ncbi:glycosyltransferase family 4 protein [Klebsiella pneumoniae]|uniref:glycosyltransferase family 4 protein n=1 Tax=Klebsiella pneumoniae TaxID=573 RepID=UPI001F4CA8D4|nr:glycosyltransferase family 1 protein [Klebsiella pneumoniae]MCP6553272.1 glycosyltransferase family 4 protein [Klebsiella pneumoniae]MCP6581956.1 glycosyltransferase family 4 protein [Klebsiella pneumoniae]MCP6611935.1 glycosyltransferase family 4 protein [Klebsiella pneumoniae]MCQ0500996.1 glycosyltransferase family 4 protein [Klebsiella pneumoniae]MCS6334825.1 glycosyltransferase family 4 protein [Klebsiella pneumoniae]
MIYINARFLSQKITGVQRFAREISKQLNKIRNDITFLVPSVNDVINFDDLEGGDILEVKGGRGHYWEQITLPFFLRQKQSPLLLNLCNAAPAFYHNQISTIHDITYLKYPQSYSLKFRTLYGLLTPLLLRNSRAILTVSDFSKKDISEHYNCDEDKISVIYNSVSDVFTGKDIKKDSFGMPYILAVSSQNYHKNFHGLIRAFSKYDGALQLKIIGGKTKAFNGIDLTSEDSRISFLGRVSDEELAELYSNASCFIFPSLYEGFGIPPLEAQACGCPVVSSNRASMIEVLGRSAIYFDPESDSEILEAINQITTDSTLREKLVQSGFINFKRFSWYDSAFKINTIIKSLEHQ